MMNRASVKLSIGLDALWSVDNSIRVLATREPCVACDV